MTKPKKTIAKTDGTTTSSASTSTTSEPGVDRDHLRFGWWSLLVFLVVGIALEVMHGFKVGFYLDVDQQTRRFMWTLGHAHGTLLSLVQIAFALSGLGGPTWSDGARRVASRCLRAAVVLMPAGFFLGGAFTYGGDPGLGIFLVGPGGVLLLVGVLLTARAFGR